MKQQLKNKIRALVLLTVLSLNTVAGFACSVGIDLGYNSKHHEHNQFEGETHHHENGHEARHTPTHLNSVVSGATIGDVNNDCCSGQVSSFAQLDKSVVYNNLLLKAPVFSLLSIFYFLSSEITDPAPGANSRFQVLRRRPLLNDISIRIAIQSFQI